MNVLKMASLLWRYAIVKSVQALQNRDVMELAEIEWHSGMMRK